MEAQNILKKLLLILLCILLVFPVSGCAGDPAEKEAVAGNRKTYYAMSDGTWMCDDCIYKYRLEISGRMPNAAVDSTFVYLSNREEISFEQAFKAAGISSDLEDYFSPSEAVLVEIY